MKSRNTALILLFAAILLIIAGGLCTHFTSRSMSLHLREGTVCPSSDTLPFGIRLNHFDIQYHEGTLTPKDFASHISLFGHDGETRARVSMNKVYRYKGFRILQENYDEDFRGSTLLIRYDPWGTGMVYGGYALLLLSILWLLSRREGAFRRLLRTLSVMSLFLISTPAISHPLLNPEEADAFGRLSIYYNGRIAPYDSYARDYCKLVFAKEDMPMVGNPVQIVTDIYLFPQYWTNFPRPAMRIFPQQNLWLAPGDDFSGAAQEDTLFMAHILTWLRQNMQEGNSRQNMEIILSIAKFQEKRCVPGSVDRNRESMEIAYHRFQPEKKIFIMELSMALFLLMMLISRLHPAKIQKTALIFLVIALCINVLNIIWRCYVSGHNPFSSTFDTLLLLSCGILCIALVMKRKENVIMITTLIASAFIILAATIMANSTFSPLQPVLVSPWLTFHVAIIMTAYCLFAFSFLLAIISITIILFRKNEIKLHKTKNISQIFCITGVVLLATGIMIGSVWANISWGQYWSWDPKESWALITLLGYCIALPGVVPVADRKIWVYHLINMAAFGLLLMTYFGVSLWFGGMHAY
ncbi:MAG: cytochrome c biogenesis protein CcsA [Bacteroidales bacterium]|nr:cytochrome c biogenesis protein CcsA [Bacteroidales bacterium]